MEMKEFKLTWERADREEVQTRYLCSATVEAGTIEDALKIAEAHGWDSEVLEPQEADLLDTLEQGDPSLIMGEDGTVYYMGVSGMFKVVNDNGPLWYHDGDGWLVVDPKNVEQKDLLVIQDQGWLSPVDVAEEYVANQGGACPYCKSSKVSGSDTDTLEQGEITQVSTCEDCGKSWTDVYTLTSVVLEQTS